MNKDMKLINLRVIFIPLLVIIICSCNGQENAVVLPDTEIIFQTTTLYDSSEENDFQVGFVNSDGTGRTFFTIPKSARWWVTPYLDPKSIVFPIISDDNALLIFGTSAAPGYHASLIIWEIGDRAKECDTDTHVLSTVLRSSFVSDQVILVWVNNFSFPLGLYEIDNCGRHGSATEIISSDSTYQYFWNGNVSKDQTWFVYSHGEEGKQIIYLRNLLTEEEKSLGVGAEPVWSPDGSKIAYISANGISIMDTEGTSQLLVEYQNPEHGGTPATAGDWPPILSWSPDSRWLTYHKCTLPPSEDTLCRSIEDFSIFKVNITTGEETLITDGGLNPYWKK
jgi:Tol biopolymer transport system component